MRRRQRFARIANIPGMTAAALRAALNTSHSTMPNLVIKDDDADSIIAYILSLRDSHKSTYDRCNVQLWRPPYDLTLRIKSRHCDPSALLGGAAMLVVTIVAEDDDVEVREDQIADDHRSSIRNARHVSRHPCSGLQGRGRIDEGPQTRRTSAAGCQGIAGRYLESVLIRRRLTVNLAALPESVAASGSQPRLSAL